MKIRPQKFVIVVTGAPYTMQCADSALNFSRAVIAKGHLIEQVFFYYDGVYLASSIASPEQTERNIYQLWSEFAKQHQIECVVCSSAGMKRGVLDSIHAQMLDKPTSNLDAQFKLQGLGQFVQAIGQADKVISFGLQRG